MDFGVGRIVVDIDISDIIHLGVGCRVTLFKAVVEIRISCRVINDGPSRP